MNLFENYLLRHANYKPFILNEPSPGLKTIVVIPCLNEPTILKTIESLWNCAKPISDTEIIVVINSSEKSGESIKYQNNKSNEELNEWVHKFNGKSLALYVIKIENLNEKIAGVGYARKTGMDEAISRFLKSGNIYGTIVSLDADSVVDNNYLVEIEKLFASGKRTNGCSIYFEHQQNEIEQNSEISKRITEYELYLRYYKNALKYTGFPYYHYTIGSCFAVSAIVYCKAGGMNRKKAGEDFYFLQKIMPFGNYFELNSTCVHPSSRPSDRVPFGTGAFISSYQFLPEKKFLTYQFAAFIDLKKLFDDIQCFFRINPEQIESKITDYPQALKSFLIHNGFKENIISINKNSSSAESFRKRFYSWFNAFKVLRFLNSCHENFYHKELVKDCLMSYLYHTNKTINQTISSEELLLLIKKEEKGRDNLLD
ncbi:MAG: glycosyltransferase [Bacteroidales bacterium]